MEIGRLGVLAVLDLLSGSEAGALARRIEALGYDTLWIPEILGREIFSFATHLLGQTERMIVGTGVAIAFEYEPIVAASAAKTIGELHPDRFILGLGVSNRRINAVRGVRYEAPVRFMEDYLARLEAAPYNAVPPRHKPPVMLAAMMPKMLRLAAARTQGTITYLTTVEQLRGYREVLGPDPWLCAIQMMVLETDATRARDTARRQIAIYLQIDHYVRRLRKLGFGDDELRDGGSDRLVDALVAWGSEETLRRRVAELIGLGATQVCLLPLRADGGPGPDVRALEALAPR
jgi:probable F420-dependent oxidoreductase